MMNHRVHLLKCWPEYYEATISGHKTFDIRKNDREFMVGDILSLQEWDPSEEEVYFSLMGGDGPGQTCFKAKGYTGRTCLRRITYILSGGQFGLEEGYVVMSHQVV